MIVLLESLDLTALLEYLKAISKGGFRGDLETPLNLTLILRYYWCGNIIYFL